MVLRDFSLAPGERSSRNKTLTEGTTRRGKGRLRVTAESGEVGGGKPEETRGYCHLTRDKGCKGGEGSLDPGAPRRALLHIQLISLSRKVREDTAVLARVLAKRTAVIAPTYARRFGNTWIKRAGRKRRREIVDPRISQSGRYIAYLIATFIDSLFTAYLRATTNLHAFITRDRRRHDFATVYDSPEGF